MCPVRLWTRCEGKPTVEKDRDGCWHRRPRKREREMKEKTIGKMSARHLPKAPFTHPPVVGEKHVLVHLCVCTRVSWLAVSVH